MIASGGEVRVGDESPAELERLEAEELRLLEAIGDHLPVELAKRVERPRAPSVGRRPWPASAGGAG